MFEINLEERIKLAKKKARNVYYGTMTSIDEETLRLHFILSKHYNIPLFSDYFSKRTIDDLIFEVELIYLSKIPEQQQTSDIVTKMRKDSEAGKKTELDELFDDLIEDSKNKSSSKSKSKVSWSDVNTDSSTANSDQIDEIEKAFLETGNFQGDE